LTYLAAAALQQLTGLRLSSTCTITCRGRGQHRGRGRRHLAGHGRDAAGGSGSDRGHLSAPSPPSPALQEGDAFGPTLQQASAAPAGKKPRSRLTQLKEDDDRSSDSSAPAATLNGSASRLSLVDAGGDPSSAAPSEAGSNRAAWQPRDGSFAQALQKGLPPPPKAQPQAAPAAPNGVSPIPQPDAGLRASASPSVTSDDGGGRQADGRASPFEQAAVAYRSAHPAGSESGSSRAPSQRSAASRPGDGIGATSPPSQQQQPPPQRSRSTALTEAALREAAAAERLRGDGGSHAPDRPASGGSCSDSERSSAVVPADDLHQNDLTWRRGGASSRLSTSALSEASLSSWAVTVRSQPFETLRRGSRSRLWKRGPLIPDTSLLTAVL